MCFSAQASFTGSAIITAIGIAALTRVRKTEQVPFAGIPIIFGIQQCAEGVLWITLKSGAHANLQNAATHIFLVTALIIWPTMVPVSVWLIEKNSRRKKLLSLVIAAGVIVSVFYAFCLFSYNVTPRIQSFHIQYIDEFPHHFVAIAFVLYLSATITPLFLSSIKRMWLFGVLICISVVVTAVFYAQYLTSVWCFFAALISISIYWILSDVRKTTEQTQGNAQSQAD